MDLTNEEVQQNIELVEGETFKLDVGGIKTLERTVSAGNKGIITIMYQEVKL